MAPDDHDTPTRAERLTDEDVAANQADRIGSAPCGRCGHSHYDHHKNGGGAAGTGCLFRTDPDDKSPGNPNTAYCPCVKYESNLDLELESARRVVASCAQSGHAAATLACAPCIAAYAQQLRADRRLMRNALEREQAEIKKLREQKAALVEIIRSAVASADACPCSQYDPSCKCGHVDYEKAAVALSLAEGA